MNLSTQKRIAAKILKCGVNRIWFDSNRLSEIKEAITKTDIRTLIKDLAIQKRPEQGIAKFRARKNATQKRKGRRKGKGSRKGSRTARLPRKQAWMMHIRSLRALIRRLKANNKIENTTYRDLMSKSKGGYFRSLRHMKLYLEEKSLIKK